MDTEAIYRLRQLYTLPPEALLSREDAALYLGVSVSTLATWASRPPKQSTQPSPPDLAMVHIGTLCKYMKRDLDAFIAARRYQAVRSTGREEG